MVHKGLMLPVTQRSDIIFLNLKKHVTQVSGTQQWSYTISQRPKFLV